MNSFVYMPYLRIKILIFFGMIYLFTSSAYGESKEPQNHPTIAKTPPSADPPLDSKTASEFSLEEVIPDPKPTNLARNNHYLVSNENHHHQFYQSLLDQKGGIYLGVGGEQNYLLAGWAQADIIILMDFDQMVVDLHKLYRMMFLKAGSPKEFLAFFSDTPRMRKQIESWILEWYGVRNDQVDGHAKNLCTEICKAVTKVYRVSLGHRLIPRRLAWIQKQYRRLAIPTFLTDQAQYLHIKELFQKNQVFMVRGDLSKDMLAKVAEKLKNSSKTIRLLYLSNAERYFLYDPSFRKNMKMIPFDTNALILRTWALRDQGNRYAYFIQKATHFLGWLGQNEVTNVRPILRTYLRGIRSGKFGAFPYNLFSIDQLPKP